MKKATALVLLLAMWFIFSAPFPMKRQKVTDGDGDPSFYPYEVTYNGTNVVTDDGDLTATINWATPFDSRYLKLDLSNTLTGSTLNTSYSIGSENVLTIAGTTANQDLRVDYIGAGTGGAYLLMYDEDSSHALGAGCWGDRGDIWVGEIGTYGVLHLQAATGAGTGHAVYIGGDAADGRTGLLEIRGFNTGYSREYGRLTLAVVGSDQVFQITSDTGEIHLDNENLTTEGSGTFNQINSDSYYAGDGVNLWGSTDGSTFTFNMDAETGGAFISFDILADNYYDQDGNTQWGETAGSGNFTFYGTVKIDSGLVDTSGVLSVEPNNRILTDQNGDFALDFTTNRFLARAAGSHSLDWESGQWIASDGTVQGDYNTAGTLDFQDNDVTFTGLLTAGGPTQSGVHMLEGDTFPTVRIQRNTATTANIGAIFTTNLKTSGDMANGHGPTISFEVQDDTAGPNIIASIGAFRRSNDTSGRLIFNTYNSGASSTKFYIEPDGDSWFPIDNQTLCFGAGTDMCLSSDGTNGVVTTPNGKLILPATIDVGVASGAETLITVKSDTTKSGEILHDGTDFWFRGNAVGNQGLRFGRAGAATVVSNYIFNMNPHVAGEGYHWSVDGTDIMKLEHTGNLEMRNTLNALADVGVVDNYALFLRKTDTQTSQGPGLAFTATSTEDIVGAAIIHERTGANSRGDLHFYTKAGTGTEDPIKRYTIDADGLHKFGDGAWTNYSKFEVDGTLEFNGTATVWEDMQFQVSDAKVTPASLLPSWEAFTTNTSEYAFSVNDEVDTSANEIPHSWKQGTAGNAHIHITTKAVPAQEQKAQFTVTFAYADTNEVWVEAPLTAELTIPIATTALTNFYLDLGDLTLTNYLIGAQMRCRVKRVAKSAGGTEYAGDIFITQVGVHFEENTCGSRQEILK